MKQKQRKRHQSKRKRQGIKRNETEKEMKMIRK